MADDEQLLPIANVGRIMKQVLPPSAEISKEAKQTMQECATEFISFVTGEASDNYHKENRKTANGDDICWALSVLGLDNYTEATVKYSHKYREAEREKANQNKAAENQEKDGDPDHQSLRIEGPRHYEHRVIVKSNSSHTKSIQNDFSGDYDDKENHETDTRELHRFHEY